MDHHHRPPEQRPRQAAEGHLSRAGVLRDAAARVAAATAVAQPEHLSADAALVEQPNGAWRGVAGLTLPLLACLETHTHTHTRSKGVNMVVVVAGEGNRDGFGQVRAHQSSGGCLNPGAGPHIAKSGFHLQLAGRVLVGHPCGEPSPTALGTGTPLGALLWTGGAGRD